MRCAGGCVTPRKLFHTFFLNLTKKKHEKHCHNFQTPETRHSPIKDLPVAASVALQIATHVPRTLVTPRTWRTASTLHIRTACGVWASCAAVNSGALKTESMQMQREQSWGIGQVLTIPSCRAVCVTCLSRQTTRTIFDLPAAGIHTWQEVVWNRKRETEKRDY